DPGCDAVVFSEADERFHVTVGATRSGAWIIVSTASRDTNEQWLIPAGNPTAPARCVEGRRRGVEYFLEHLVPAGPAGQEAFAILTNEGAPEYRVVVAPVDHPEAASWTEVVAGTDGTRLGSLEVFAGHLVLHCRRAGAEFLTVVRPDRTSYEVPADMPGGTIEVDGRDSEGTTQPVVVTESLVMPRRWWALELASGERRLIRDDAAPGHRPGDYILEQIRARAPDGALVPVTIAYRSGLPADGTHPCLLGGYGAYETRAARGFSTAVPSLLDRGFLYAVAHVRGGGECGRGWWLDGRLSAKHHTFTDFVAVRDFLVAERRVAPGKVVCRGLSAGGLLTGVAYTFWPERWAGVVAEAPAVDLLNQMLHAVRECRRRTPAPAARHGDPPRPAGDGLRSGPLGGGAAGRGHPGQRGPVPGRAGGRGPPRAVRAVGRPRLRGGTLRLDHRRGPPASSERMIRTQAARRHPKSVQAQSPYAIMQP
ncbi:MAG: hypothetical protein E6G66_17800, partial [Actinobacteria bacterium]